MTEGLRNEKDDSLKYYITTAAKDVIMSAKVLPSSTVRRPYSYNLPTGERYYRKVGARALAVLSSVVFQDENFCWQAVRTLRPTKRASYDVWHFLLTGCRS